MTEKKISVVLIDDHPALCVGLRVLINNESDMLVVGETGDGNEGIDLVQRLKPDIVVLDYKLPGKNGVDVAISLKKSNIETRILVLSSYTETLCIKAMLQAGVSGYLLKDEAPPYIINAIRMIMQGKTWYSQSIASKMADMVGGGQMDMSSLSKREIEVLARLAQGLSNREIAEKLFVSERTVRFHLRNIYSKLYVNSRAEAIVCAIRNGLGDH